MVLVESPRRKTTRRADSDPRLDGVKVSEIS